MLYPIELWVRPGTLKSKDRRPLAQAIIFPLWALRIAPKVLLPGEGVEREEKDTLRQK